MEVGLLTEWAGNALFHGNPAWREPPPLVFSHGNWEGVVVCETPGMAPSSPSPSLPCPIWISGKCGAVSGLLWESQPGIQERQGAQSCPRVTPHPAGNQPGALLGMREAPEAQRKPGQGWIQVGWGHLPTPPVLTPVPGPHLPLQAEPGIPGDAAGSGMEDRAGLELGGVWCPPPRRDRPWRGWEGSHPAPPPR